MDTATIADKVISHLLTWRKAGERPDWPAVSHLHSVTKAYWSQWDSLALRNGDLYHRWQSPKHDWVTWQLVLSTELCANVLKRLHDSPVIGHLGVSKSLGKVCEKFSWIHYRRDVEEW